MHRTLAILGILTSPSAADCAEPAPRYADRWVYVMHNLQVDANADEVVKLIDRAAKSGYTGIVLADFKLRILDHVTQNWFRNAERVKRAAAAKVEVIPAVFPIGYSSGLLFHDPNLAEGVPVRDAPFVVKDGTAALAPTETGFKNGDFELSRGDRFTGFAFQDEPGKATFADCEVFAGGKQSLRMQDAAGNCRVSQRVAVRPWACYRLSAKVRTRDLKGGFKLLALGKGGRPLTFHEAHLKPTQDWAEIEVTFNSLASSEATVYLGVWGGFKGTVWVDDWKLEELRT